MASSAFRLPEHLSHKTKPSQIDRDERHFAHIARTLDETIADVSARLSDARHTTARLGQEAIERDREISRLSSRLRMLRRFGLDVCLGHMLAEDSADPVYVGRLGLTDNDGNRLLVDWRSPAAEPFFGATHANPMGLVRRRRYRWSGGLVNDYWDEVFTADGLDNDTALDDQSAFIASLGTNRSEHMRDVLGTIAADQDAVVRASSRGALVVDGGPGTGKTVVALHRAAYLLYADPDIGHHRGRVLFVGPHEPYLAYVANVLPNLGEEGVQICTVRDLVREGATAIVENDPDVARLKSLTDMVRTIDSAVRFYEQPPRTGMTVETDWTDLWLSPEDWAEAFTAPEPGTPHNEAREQIWDLLVDILRDKSGGIVSEAELRRSLTRNDELRSALDNAWTLIEAADLVADLWSVPAYLRRCAPWLTPDDVQRLQRADPAAWTDVDLPLIDVARLRLGDPEATHRHRQREDAIASERRGRSAVIEDLIASNSYSDGEGLMAQLRHADLQDMLVDEEAFTIGDPDLLTGPFAHIVVDEAQELTDAQWHMLVQRCPARSFTIVGDRAQARHGFTESWAERLDRIGLNRVSVAALHINYRTPEEVMATAEPVIRAALPDANVPTSIRRSGIPVRYGTASELVTIVDEWLSAHTEGVVCVIGEPGFAARPRVRSLTPTLAKGLEFDVVVLVRPEDFGEGVVGAVDRYVAMTRATQELVVLTR